MSAATNPSREALLLELRRGVVALAILGRLRSEEYGYALKRSLSELGIEIDEGTLYPLLRRLEGQGLLESRWTLGDKRPRRYYRTSAAGASLLEDLAGEWRALNDALGRLLP